MSTFKVSKEIIEIFPHPNADSLEIGKVGTRQVVVQKGLYQTGNEVIFAPSKSVLPEGRIKTEFKDYLVGDNKDRVSSIHLRNELSDGIIIPKELIDFDLDTVSIGEDISQRLGIYKYEKKIPEELLPFVKNIDFPNYYKHDCEQFRIYSSQLADDEQISIEEKIHGTQVTAFYDFDVEDGFVSSKGLLDDGFCFIKSEGFQFDYIKAVNNTGIFELIKKHFSTGQVQVFGEGIPVFSGFNYGLNSDTKRVLLFDVFHNGKRIPYNDLHQDFKDIWVPVFYIGKIKFDEERNLSKELVDFRSGKETVSGKSLHIKEGIVIRTIEYKRAFDNTKLILKLINPKYKESGEETN
jgi:RNA ligase (TIGR02306 family)